VLQKWFLVDLNFQALNSKEDEKLEENSPPKVRRRNLLPSLGVQSQGAPMDMEELFNPK
jgi:hypothetical protein